MASSKVIAHELSSDIASEILSVQDRSQLSLDELKEIVLKVHFTLQEMAEEQDREQPLKGNPYRKK